MQQILILLKLNMCTISMCEYSLQRECSLNSSLRGECDMKMVC